VVSLKVKIERKDLTQLLFRVDYFGDRLIEEGNYYKNLVKEMRKEYLFKTRKELE
jgi:hypothetical protein